MNGVIENRMVYYGEDGCCLTCPNAHLGCLCFNCRCRVCAHYDSELRRCSIAVARQDKWERVYVDIDDVVAETEKAWCVKTIDIGLEDIEVWIPKSMAKIVTLVEHTPPDGTLSHWQNKKRKVKCLILPKWLAVEKRILELDEFDYWGGE